MSTEKTPRTLVGVRCRQCGKVQAAPAWACTNCGSDQISEEIPLRGEATVVSHTVVRRSSPGFPDVPYMIIVAKLMEGVEILGWLEGFENASIGVGTPVRFSHFDYRKIPQFSKIND